jgi:threonine dehydratase
MLPRRTTLLEVPRLAERLGVDLVLATETFQRTGSFKYRPAWQVATSIPNPAVLAASSGNFGQAIACACREVGKRCTVVMPAKSARVKIEAVRSYGAAVDLVDTALVSRSERVRQLAALDPDAYVASAYDDPYVIEGNATLGAELVAAGLGLAQVVVPVGGGGLSSGLVLAMQRAGVPTRVVGAEPLLANDAARSLREGRLVANAGEPETVADGARVASLGGRNWAILQTGLEGIVEVGEAEIREAMRLLFGLANLKAEPTGALAAGAVLAAPSLFRNGRVCCVVTGGNVDAELYADVLRG